MYVFKSKTHPAHLPHGVFVEGGGSAELNDEQYERVMLDPCLSIALDAGVFTLEEVEADKPEPKPARKPKADRPAESEKPKSE